MAIKFLNTVQVDTDVLYVDASSNNVGIGTTSPSTKLHISDASTPEVRIQDTTNNRYLSLFQNDSNSYIQSSLNSALVLLTHGANERMRITTAGNVGIGTTSPSEKLQVNGAALIGDLRLISAGGTDYIQSDANIRFSPVGTSVGTRMIILSTGNVGIGTTSPGSKLTVDGTTRLGGDVEVSELLTGDRVLTLTANGGSFEIGDIDGLGDQAFISGDGSSISISTNQITTLHCDSSNRVGIGTTSPKAKLHVVSGTSGATWAATAGTTGVFESSTGDRSFVTITGEDEAELWFGDFTTQAKGRVRYQTDTNVMSFWTNGSQKMTIDASGNVGNISNVGIGTTSLTTISSAVATLSLGSTSASTSGGIAFQANGVVKAYNYVASNYLYNQTVASIGQIFFGAGSERMRIHNTTGNVGIGTTSPNSKLHVAGTVSLSTPLANFNGSVGSGTYGAVSVRVDNINYGTAMKFYRSLTADNNAIGFQNGASTVGSISIGASSTSYNTTSDYRLKENLTAITDGIDRLKQLKPRRFNFIGNADVVDGFIAHEAKEVIPESVTGEKDEVLPNGDPVYQGIDQAKIVPLLTAALQEAISKIEQLETRIQTLENK